MKVQHSLPCVVSVCVSTDLLEIYLDLSAAKRSSVFLNCSCHLQFCAGHAVYTVCFMKTAACCWTWHRLEYSNVAGPTSKIELKIWKHCRAREETAEQKLRLAVASPIGGILSTYSTLQAMGSIVDLKIHIYWSHHILKISCCDIWWPLFVRLFCVNKGNPQRRRPNNSSGLCQSMFQGWHL